ncbi:hypothetical protein PR002_g18203 [Phytophthora rubi]|uniref:U4/U6.U5 small nuclear ribonucleoprotein 27kDa protein domain-containing protein n=1 Tax=Phytophthora rubi TaxID=129364 RepID=A0A6A3JZX6_9STRA|nr:hypothetical protein PR002_g18203 [Phytophthora rubi]
MPRSRSRSGSLDSLGRRRRRDAPSSSRRRRRSVANEPERKKEDAEQQKENKKEEEAVNAMSHLSEEQQMQLLLGFGDFDSTKGKAVDENLKSAAVGTARRENKREYRQYMNRRGGFNRPLDK